MDGMALQLDGRLPKVPWSPSAPKQGLPEPLSNGGTSAINANVVSYAPSDNPKIAV